LGKQADPLAGVDLCDTEPDFHRRHCRGGRAGGAFWAMWSFDGALRTGLLLVAGLGCQVRLLCNIMDGLVAI